jgi:hypothetical protein
LVEVLEGMVAQLMVPLVVQAVEVYILVVLAVQALRVKVILEVMEPHPLTTVEEVEVGLVL